MRAKRSKKYRKIMQQYEMTFGFREPYQVLVDSRFLLAIQAFSMPLVPSLERTLHGKVKPFITKCSLAAVNDRHAATRVKLPSSNSSSRPMGRPTFLPLPTELPLRHCDHGDRGTLNESQCLLELVSGGTGAAMLNGESIGQGKQPKNREHYIIATADAEAGEKIAPIQTTGQKRKRGDTENIDIRSLVREVPGVPIIYVKRSVMILEELSGASLGHRRKGEKEKLAEGVPTGKRKLPSTDDAEEEEDQMGLGMRKIRGAKKAKGPNPLSVKKKKVKVHVNGVKVSKGGSAASQATTNPDHDSDKPKAKRRRKHSKKSSSVTEPDGVTIDTSANGALES